jgi:2-dehydro-3-deoxyphosphogluconate aldolase/(4S)-4-hydroxy-2-oxoglutarate aldolase
LGGVTAANMAEYLAIPGVAAVGGTWLCERRLVREKRWADIAAFAGEAVRRGAAQQQQEGS